MKKIFLLLSLCLAAIGVQAQSTFINLTPRPKSMTVSNYSLPLTDQYVVGWRDLSEEELAEAQRFVDAIYQATGLQGTLVENAEEPLFDVAPFALAMNEGAYRLQITSSKCTVRARDVLGYYYAFQSIKKILPANVMAGVRDESVTEYVLPGCVIDDEPRFAYRGFMLDVSRHFFTVDEVKRMLDMMAVYKMNRFHWHLSDDQGWRVQIDKYPKLTTIGATSPNCRITDMDTKTQYWTGQTYGPYFYTKEEIRDVVAYAKERHIEIIPEIDMPGHFVAALCAYPEYSCTPNASRTVWCDGGISSDVLNVANPDAVQFCKDILDELMELFPYDVIHIGGDECPTSAWENNAQCQARYAELGLSSYRALQSYFIKDLAEHVASKGKRLAVWNEAISASGAITSYIQDADAMVYCWTGADAAANSSANLKLQHIYTPWGPYYINRRQSADDPPGAGGEPWDDVKKTYGTNPASNNYTVGVQGTFWTEHVSDRRYMEYLALPRLLAIAEHGWTPQARKSFEDFQERMSADTLLFQYGGYEYSTYHMLLADPAEPEARVMPSSDTWYKITTRASDAERSGRVWELLREGSPIISEQSGKNAKALRLWTASSAEEGDEAYDYQLWTAEESATAPGYYALVCKALPEGSLKQNPTASTVAGRWDYDTAAKHYDFLLGDYSSGYGKLTDDTYYYSIRSKNVSNYWMNASLGGQGYAVNCYGNPSDGDSGLWAFVPVASAVDGISAAAYATSRASQIYDLSGRRRADVGRGVNIVNGRKVIR